MTLLSKLRAWRRNTIRSTPPIAEASSKRKRKWKTLTLLGALPLILILPLAIPQLAVYRNNLGVENKDWPLATPLKKSDRLLIISPHCDDETLGAGGTIAAARQMGASVRVVFITNGDGSHATRYVVQARELKAKINPLNRQQIESKSGLKNSDNLFQGIAAMRRREAIAACEKLGVDAKDVIFLGYPDGGTQAMWETNWSDATPFRSPYTNSTHSPYANSFTTGARYSGAQVVRDLEKIARQYKPTIVMTTHPEDTHPDHWAAYAYSSAVVEKLRLDTDRSTQVWAAQMRLLGFLVHHGIWPTPNGYHPAKHLLPPASLVESDTRWRIKPLSQSAQAAKKSALECYTSQLATTPRYLRAFVRRNELFGVPTNSPQRTDPPSDSSWSEAWPAADIRSIRLQDAPGVLTLQTELAGAPSSRVQYRYAIHVVTAKEITAWQIEARQKGDSMQVNLTRQTEDQQISNRDADRSTLKTTLTANGFTFDLPRSALGVLDQPATLLISAATLAGAARLDQTATATFSNPQF